MMSENMRSGEGRRLDVHDRDELAERKRRPSGGETLNQTLAQVTKRHARHAASLVLQVF